MLKNLKLRNMLMSLFLCMTLIVSYLPIMPSVVLAEESTTKTVATEAEFEDALKDENIKVIQLQKEITLSRSQDGDDNVFVIGRDVTIRGGGLRLERAGIILGGAITFENMFIYFANPVRNAIIANGYDLTLSTVTTKGSAYSIDIFCGGISDYTGENSNEIPVMGTNANITIKGKNQLVGTSDDSLGGTIYAGSLSDLGKDVADIANDYSGNVNITIEDSAEGISEIYAHGARENRDGGFPNAWKSDAGLYKVSGEVTVALKTNTPITVHGKTGSEKNAAFIYSDSGNGYVCSPTLEDVRAIQLIPVDGGKRTYLAPVIAGENSQNFTSLSVPVNTKLSFVNMGETIGVSNFSGGGELVFKEGKQCLNISEAASGATKIAVKDIAADGVSSSGSILEGQTYITLLNTNSDAGFELLPSTSNPNMIIKNDGNGNWITEQTEPDIVVVSVGDLADIEKTEEELVTEGSIMIPLTIAYGESENSESSNPFFGDIPMYITINGKETIRTSSEYVGYEYTTGDEDNDILMCFDYDYSSTSSDGECLYIQAVGEDSSISAGRYEVSIVIPARYMESGVSRVIDFVLTIVCDNDKHTGGTADCKHAAICEVCGKTYGEIDSNRHTGGTELKNQKEATKTEPGYTGDTYCLGCDTMIQSGKEIPVLTTPENPDDTGEPDDTEKPGDTEEPGDTEKPGDTEEPGDIEKPGDTEEPGDTEKPGDTGNLGGAGNNEVPDSEDKGDKIPQPDEIITQVNTDSKLPKLESLNLNAAFAKNLLSEEELKEVEAGASVSVYIEAEEINHTVSEADKTAIHTLLNDQLKDAKVGLYLDLTLYKQIGDKAASQISDTNGKQIQLQIHVPEEIRNTNPNVRRMFYIVRVHDGKAEFLTGGTTAHTLTFETGLFSTYGIVYYDIPIQGNVTAPKTEEGISWESWLLLFSSCTMFLIMLKNRKKNAK